MEFFRVDIENVRFRGGLLGGGLSSGLGGLLCYCLGGTRSGAITRCIIDADSWLHIINIDAV